MNDNLQYCEKRSDYTILSLKDFSHGGVKRYASNVLLKKEYTKNDMVEIVKIITKKLEALDSQVICLFLYSSLDDLCFKNWIYQTQWISKEFPPNFSFVTLEGMQIDDETVITSSEVIGWATPDI